MRKLIPLTLLAAVLAALPARAESIVWETDFDKAKARALAEGKPMFIDIYTDWCHFCSEMDVDTYTRPEVIAFMKTVIPVKANPEKSPSAKTLSGKLNVSGYPTLVFMDAFENVLHKDSGKPPAESFLDGLCDESERELVAATNGGAQDMKKVALATYKLEKWLGTVPSAADRVKSTHGKFDSDPAFTEAYNAAKKEVEDKLTATREAAEKARLAREAAERKTMIEDAAAFSKKSQKKEAIELWKKIVATWPDSEEAKTARGRLKFYGVKLDEPKKDDPPKK